MRWAERRRRHKTAAPWEELREKYEAGGYTYVQLAKEYGVSVQTVGRHARKENWVSGCRNERRRRAESRNCLLQMTWALMRGAKRAAEEAEKGEACTKELKELAGKYLNLAELEQVVGGGTGERQENGQSGVGRRPRRRKLGRRAPWCGWCGRGYCRRWRGWRRSWAAGPRCRRCRC